MNSKLSDSKKSYETENIRIDGLSDILFAELAIQKLLFGFFIILGSCFCCYLIVDSILIYLKYDVLTNVRLVTPIRSTFPTLMICNSNSLNSQYYVRMLKDANLTEFSQTPYFNMVALEEYQKRTTNSYLTIEQKRAMFDEDGFIISRTFQNRPCNKSQISYLYIPYFLNCIQFNGKSNQTDEASVEGENDELTMEFYVGMPNELSQIVVSRSVLFKVLNSTEDPTKDTPSVNRLMPGYATKISVKKNIFKQFNAWPYQYSGCNVNEDGRLIQPIKDRRFFDYTVGTNYTYAQDSCLLYCCEHLSRRICNCSTQWNIYAPDNQYDICRPKDNECIIYFYYSVFTIGDYILKNCLDKCPFECHMHRYDLFQSINAYPERGYLENTLKKNPMLLSHYANQTDFTERLAQNVIKFSVTVDSMSHTEVSEEPKVTWMGLLASLGGHLHLFLGMSIMSFLELFELILKIVFSIIRI